jgi:hypothetical protein
MISNYSRSFFVGYGVWDLYGMSYRFKKVAM